MAASRTPDASFEGEVARFPGAGWARVAALRPDIKRHAPRPARGRKNGR